MELGVETGGHRNAEPTGGLQRGPAQGAFGGDMHHIGALGCPMTHQMPFYRQAEAQPAVTGDRRAGNQQLFAVLACFTGARLARADHLDPVPVVAQAVDDAGQRHSDAVDLRRPGFGNQGDVA